MLQVRYKIVDGLLVRLKTVRGDVREMVSRTLPGSAEAMSRAYELVDMIMDVVEQNKFLEENNPRAEFIPSIDWRAVTMVSDWLPDGVLINRDDDEQNGSYFHAGGGDSGGVLNVAIQGPTFLRNAVISHFERNGDELLDQMVDPDPWIMDRLYILLVATPVKDAAGVLQHYSFKFNVTSARIIKLNTDRILANSRRVATGGPSIIADEMTGYPNKDCISAHDVSHAVAVWKLGSVMDNKLVTGKHAKMKINVCIEEMFMYDAYRVFGVQFGKSNGGRFDSFKSGISYITGQAPPAPPPEPDDGGGGGGDVGFSLPPSVPEGFDPDNITEEQWPVSEELEKLLIGSLLEGYTGTPLAPPGETRDDKILPRPAVPTDLGLPVFPAQPNKGPWGDEQIQALWNAITEGVDPTKEWTIDTWSSTLREKPWLKTVVGFPYPGTKSEMGKAWEMKRRNYNYKRHCFTFWTDDNFVLDKDKFTRHFKKRSTPDADTFETKIEAKIERILETRFRGTDS